MKKHTLMLGLVALCATMLCAQSPYDKYYTNLPIEIEHVKPIVIPELTVQLSDFGAVADGKTLNTDAFKQAVNALKKQGGGHLIVPAGEWLTGPIVLASNIDLHLNAGAVVRFTKDHSQYILPDSKGNIPSKANACVKVSKAENVSITGQGTFDGQGQYWRPVKHNKVTDEVWQSYLNMGGTIKQADDGKPGKEMWFPYHLNKEEGVSEIGTSMDGEDKMRYHLISITDSKNILVQGVHITNSPKFHLVPTRVQNLIIDGVTIECPEWAQNGDAMDVGNTQVCLIVNCHIACGDDGICMKGGVGDKGVEAGPNRDFLIQNDTVVHAHGGFVIGSEFSGGMERFVVRNCIFDHPTAGLRFKSAPGRGGWCKDMYCYDIVMKHIGKEGAVMFQTGYADKAVSTSATATDNKETYFPDWSNFYIHDITCIQADGPAINIQGLKPSKKQPDAKPVHDIRFENVRVLNSKMAYSIENAENISFKGCTIRGKESNVIKNCKNVTADGQEITAGE